VGCCDAQGGELVGVSQAYLLKLVQSSQQHFFCKAQAFVTLDMRHHVLSMAVVTFRAVTRKWLSWWVSARPTC